MVGKWQEQALYPDLLVTKPTLYSLYGIASLTQP